MDDKTKGIGVERTAGRSDEYISGREALDTDGRIGERGTSRIPSRSTTTSTGTSSDTTRNLSSSSSMDAPTEERTREIRAEIEQTRGELSETVNAIQDRLRPGNIASNAAESVKSTVKNVASDKAQYVAETARDMADSETVQYVRSNPIPTAMIGVGLAGLTWLALSRRKGQSHDRYRTTGRTSRDWRRLAPYNESERYYRGGTGHTGYTGQSGYTAESGFGDAGFGEAGYPGQGGYETAAAYTPDLNQGAGGSYAGARGSYGASGDYGETGTDYTGRGSSPMGGMARNAGQGAQDFGRRAQQTTRSAQRKLQRSWQQNPLMMGAASAVLGLIVGMAMPQTEIENEYMGEARDNAIEGVQQSVRDTVGKVQDAATSAVGLVTGNQPSGDQSKTQNQDQSKTQNQGQGQQNKSQGEGQQSKNQGQGQGQQNKNQGQKPQASSSPEPSVGGTGPKKNPGVA